MRYQFLVYEQRLKTDNRTFGELFYACCDEIRDNTFMEAMYRILTMAIEKLRTDGDFSEEVYGRLITEIIGRAIEYFRSESTYCQRTLILT